MIYSSGMSYKDEVDMSRAMGHKTWIKLRHDKKALKKGLNLELISKGKLARLTAREEALVSEYTEGMLEGLI